MAKAASKPAPAPVAEPPPAEEVAAPPPPPEPKGPPGWGQLWQMPVLLMGVTLLGAWFYLTLTAPKPENDFAGALESVDQFIKANNYEGAREKLNEALPHIAEATQAEQAWAQQLWGDLVYLDQQAHGGDVAENHHEILKRYQTAKDLGREPDATRLQRWAQTLASLGEEDKALAIVDELKDDPSELRYGVLRQIVERRRAALAPALAVGGNAATEATNRFDEIVARFQRELASEVPAKRREQEIWLAGLQAQAMLDAGSPAKAIDTLLFRINTLAESGDGDLAPLMVSLAKAYQKAGENLKAKTWYERAQTKTESTDTLRADVLVGLAQIDMAESNDIRAALENFKAAQTQFSATSPAYFEALMGRADCEARLGAHPEAIENFARAIKFVLDEAKANRERQQALYDIIHSHFETCAEREDFTTALNYLNLMPPMYQQQPELPPKLLVEFAVTHEQLANQQMTDAANATEPATQPAENGEPVMIKTPAARVAYQQASIHFGEAAGFYLRHAHAVALADEATYGLSLWKAAASYDRAQQWKHAIDVYAEFVKTRAGDPRQLAAMLQLGLAYEADGQYQPAIDVFKQLVNTQGRSPEAYAALVPLARCFMAMGQNDDAKRTLLYVLTDHPTITPDSTPYRDALIELGRLHYRLEEYEEGIERLSLAVDRYKDGPDAADLRFRLADAYRRSIEKIDQDLLEPMPQSKKLALQAERTRRLDQALVLFSQVISELETREGQGLSPVEALSYRNAYFYRADCAYDLKRFEQAIQLYDLAAKRWENHPASLVAMVQIVNARCELGQVQQARVANRAARALLKRIPEEAFKDPSLPMSREHWEDWLKWTSELDLSGGGNGNGGEVKEPTASAVN